MESFAFPDTYDKVNKHWNWLAKVQQVAVLFFSLESLSDSHYIWGIFSKAKAWINESKMFFTPIKYTLLG